MYVYMYIYVCIFVYIYIHVCMYVYQHAIHVCVYINVYTHTHPAHDMNAYGNWDQGSTVIVRLIKVNWLRVQIKRSILAHQFACSREPHLQTKQSYWHSKEKWKHQFCEAIRSSTVAESECKKHVWVTRDMTHAYVTGPIHTRRIYT